MIDSGTLPVGTVHEWHREASREKAIRMEKSHILMVSRNETMGLGIALDSVRCQRETPLSVSLSASQHKRAMSNIGQGLAEYSQRGNVYCHCSAWSGFAAQMRMLLPLARILKFNQ